jgi:hypothetical protein
VLFFFLSKKFIDNLSLLIKQQSFHPNISLISEKTREAHMTICNRKLQANMKGRTKTNVKRRKV